MNVAGAAAFVNGPNGNTDNPVAGARCLDEHFGFGLETRGRKPQILQHIASQQTVAASGSGNRIARQFRRRRPRFLLRQIAQTVVVCRPDKL